MSLLLLALAAGCGASPSAAQVVANRPAVRHEQAAGAAPVVAVRAAPASGVEAANAGRPPARLLFVGASVTSGSGASTAAHAYPAVVGAEIEAAGRLVQLHVLARGGITVATADTWDLALPSDLVIVQLATNDFNQDVPLAAFQATYNDVLRRVRQASPRAQLLCLGGWDDPGSVNGIGLVAADYDGVAWSGCTLAGGRYVDLSAIYLDPRNHGPAGRSTYQGTGDHFHPNDRGHEELAARVLASQDLPYQVPPVALATPSPPAASSGAISD